jgi:SAM-dependent methyltransferase
MTQNPWDERYSASDYFYGKEPNDFLREQIRRLPAGGEVLCLAEGEGRNAVYLAREGFQVTAIDGSRVGLQKLEALAKDSAVSVKTICADLAEFAIEPQAWDAIIAIWCHLPTTLRRKVHAASVQGLRKGGAFLLEAYRPEQLKYGTGGPKDPDFLMNLEILRPELSGLRFEVQTEQDREIHEGKGHFGPSAVVQVLGFKG